MARYDAGCTQCGARFEHHCAIADRFEPIECPRGCGPLGMMIFSPPPASNISIPRALRTNWSDIAPKGADGHPMTFTEVVRDDRYDHYRPEVLEDAMKAEDKRQERKRERLQKKHTKRFIERAYPKVTVPA